MDMLAHYRRSQGLPALSINWGAWSEVGIAAQKSVDTRSAAQGMLSIEPKDGLFLLERMLQAGPAQLAVSPMKWPSFLKQFGSSSRMFFGRVAQIGESSTVSTAASPAETAQAAPNFAEVLMQAPPARQHLMLAEFVKARAAKVLGMDSQSIQDRTPLSELGLDSLMAVELRTQLSEGLKLKRSLPATLAFDYPTIEAITEYIARDVLELKAASPAHPVPAEPRPASALENIEDLSDEEVDRLLAQRKSGQRE
jgi:acyl carrier protein